MNYPVIFAAIFMANCTINAQADPLFFGKQTDNFIIRWAFQNYCDHVFDPHISTNRWPTKALRGVTFDPSLVKPADIIFVRKAPLFFEKLHPLIVHPYILVTHGEHLDEMKPEFLEYLDDAKIIAWFGIHPCEVKHPKFYAIPLGILQNPEHYHHRAQWDAYFEQLRKNCEKKYLLYMNFAANHKKPERLALYAQFIDKDYCYVGKQTGFSEYLQEMSQCKFTLSPVGLGPDCYRTWEALLVGSIPIVRKSHLDDFYKDLPVLMIDSWNEITPEFLNKKYKELCSKKYPIAPLYMEYWRKKIAAVRDQFLAS